MSTRMVRLVQGQSKPNLTNTSHRLHPPSLHHQLGRSSRRHSQTHLQALLVSSSLHQHTYTP
ncbi:hypothetical protein SAICODRAFT_151339 [Saitoella complicata NRRL Y-17804]|uniref:uncharacterized protein n=1 Tax=Saitoella complicata (strain BCRC 22490 / CBS 7301 / JCM 7358 / NBRC 10748 / NRRL Y-17804) TaxID=698492 RepID=UPI000867FB58|nr:uncharacterized protein SAICODRAFT_151339 [Saitoella complicata NRRL Y-17804]ODQ55764.1 hypothetical protein SAICODRAFT_151339 [Saitoella complicata NRRL Y-17804]